VLDHIIIKTRANQVD